MIAQSHDGTVAPQHVIARHTYAETAAGLLADQVGLLAEVAEGQQWIHTALDTPPAPGEVFLVFARTTWGGWRAIYLNWSAMTRFFAVRCARAAADPLVTEMKIFRGSPEEITPVLRAWRRENGVTSLNVY